MEKYTNYIRTIKNRKTKYNEGLPTRVIQMTLFTKEDFFEKELFDKKFYTSNDSVRSNNDDEISTKSTCNNQSTHKQDSDQEPGNIKRNKDWNLLEELMVDQNEKIVEIDDLFNFDITTNEEKSDKDEKEPQCEIEISDHKSSLKDLLSVDNTPKEANLIKMQSELSIQSSKSTKCSEILSVGSIPEIDLKESREAPCVGVGIFLVDEKQDKILIGRRIDKGRYGLPGGWIEFGEEWEECASRELKEETGLVKDYACFRHINTFNAFERESNFHSVSCVMLCEVTEEEINKITNKEPRKCCGWFWISINELRNIEALFNPLKMFLKMYPQITKASDLRNISRRTHIDDLFKIENISNFQNAKFSDG